MYHRILNAFNTSLIETSHLDICTNLLGLSGHSLGETSDKCLLHIITDVDILKDALRITKFIIHKRKEYLTAIKKAL